MNENLRLASTAHPAPPVVLSADAFNPESIWPRREFLTGIYLAAWRYRTSPWALLYAVLSRSITSIPWRVRYRSTLRPAGTPLTLFVSQVGRSGAGKSLLDERAAAAVAFEGFTMPALETPRSGEAIPASIASQSKSDDDTAGRLTYRGTNRAHRLYWDEIGKFQAQSGRSGSTMIEYVKEAASGGTLGGQLADGKGLVIPGGSYRVTITISVQPRRAEVLLGSAETEGGLQARIVWCSLHYPEFGEAPPLSPDRYPETLTVPLSHWEGIEYIDALPEMEAAHDLDQRRAVAGLRDPAEGHQLLNRAMIAIAAANIDGRAVLTSDDWEIAGLCMLHSQQTREWVLQEMAKPDEVEEAEQHRKDQQMIARAYARRDAGMTFGDARSRVKYGPQRDRFDQLNADGLLERWT